MAEIQNVVGEPFQYAGNVIGTPTVVHSSSANIVVSTIDKTIFDSILTLEQRDGKEALPNVIERKRHWFITNYNDFSISISLFVPKENIQPITNTLDYKENSMYYIFNYIIQKQMEDTDALLVSVCDTVMDDLDKPWSDKWKWRSVPVDHPNDITHPLFSVSKDINYIPESYELNELMRFTPLTFIYKHIYKPNKFNGKFLYAIQLKTNILKQYHRCLIPEICSLDDCKIKFSGCDTTAFTLDHQDENYLFKNKKYTFTMEIKRVYYQDNHGNRTRLDIIPLSKMKFEFKDKFNIMALAYIYKTKHLANCVPFDSAFNEHYIANCKDFPFVSCPHHIKYDLTNTTPEGNKNRSILIDKTKFALKQYRKLHNRITNFLRYYNSVEILKFAKNYKKVKTIQKQLLTASIDLSHDRKAFDADSNDPTVTCGICLENLIESGEADDATSKTYILSKCKHEFHLECIVSMNNNIRDRYNEPDEPWDYDSLKHHFQCPYCRTELSSIDIITSTSKGMGILL